MFRAKDRERCEALLDQYYSGRKFCDTIFRELIEGAMFPGARMLDAGCGSDLAFSAKYAGIARVIGLDLDCPSVCDNASSPFGVCGNLEHLPFQDGSFDLVVSHSVVEHLENPLKAFQEFYRVLRPGGRLIIATPNKWDYVSIAAACTPHSFHRLAVNRMFQHGRYEVFPTRYRANTIKALRRSLASAGFTERALTAVNHYPAYLMFSPVLFRVGVVYERLTSLEALRGLRGSLVADFEKNGSAHIADHDRRGR